MKKTFASLALAGVLTLSVGSVAAQAAPEYPATQPGATVSDGTVAPGEAVIFAGSGFTPGEIIDITVTQTSVVAGGAIGSIGGGVSMSKPLIVKAVAPQSFTATATADGKFSIPVTLNETGTYTLTATGRTSGVTVTQVVKVVANGGAVVGTDVTANGNGVAGSGNKGGLANTGIDTGVLVWSVVGAGALAAGISTVVVSRRRNAQNA